MTNRRTINDHSEGHGLNLPPALQRPAPHTRSASSLLLIAGPAPDEDLVLALLNDTFPGVRFEIRRAVSLDEGLTRLADDDFDLVLADVSRLPGEGGSVAKTLRSAHPTTPLMIITGSVEDGFDLWARVEGAPTSVASLPPAQPRTTSTEVHPVHVVTELELRTAVAGAADQLVLHYQPVVDLASGRVVAVEALVRWEHPTLGLLGPDRFVAMAESCGLIHELGDWVLNQAASDAAMLTHDGRELDIAVNFSVLQLDDRTVSNVQGALTRVGLRPGRLMIEVTETALAEDEDAVVRTLEALSRLGVNVAIDDFGTGYSSLHYLRRYPVNTIKIDREFVAGIGTAVNDEAICESIVSLASAIGATTIGEGVETAEQYAFLQSIGCTHGQGFLWAAPTPVAQLAAAFTACEETPVAVTPSRSSRPTGAGARR